MNYTNRINYLVKEYSETHANSEEVFVPNSPVKKRINQNNRNAGLRKEINKVLVDVKQKEIIFKDVEHICQKNNFRSLCGNCSREKIIAIISLYVLRQYNPKLKEEESKLWKKHDLNWRIYSRIMANLYKELVKNKGV